MILIIRPVPCVMWNSKIFFSCNHWMRNRSMDQTVQYSEQISKNGKTFHYAEQFFDFWKSFQQEWTGMQTSCLRASPHINMRRKPPPYSITRKGKALYVVILFSHITYACIRFDVMGEAVFSYRSLLHWGRGTAPAALGYFRKLPAWDDLPRSFSSRFPHPTSAPSGHLLP